MHRIVTLTLCALIGFFLTTGLNAQPRAEDERSSNEKLIDQQTLSSVEKPRRKIATFSLNPVEETLDGNQIKRTQWIGPIRFQTNQLSGWVVVPPSGPNAPYSLELTRLGNTEIRLRLNWISKGNFVQESSQLWGYAKFLASFRRGEIRYEILSEYPRTPPRKPKNYLNRIPWEVQYQIENQRTEETFLAYEIFLEFENAWLNFELVTPEEFFPGNREYLQNLLRFAQML